MSSDQSLNRYAYVNNNPCSDTDPLGLTPLIYDPAPIPFIDPFNFIFATTGGIRGDYLNIIHFPYETFLFSMLNGWGPNRPGSDTGGGNLPGRQLQALKDCTKSLLDVELRSFSPSSTGRNGSFVGMTKTGRQVSVINDVNTFTVRDLNVIFYGQPTPPMNHGDIEGLTRQGSLATKYLFGVIGYGYRDFSLSTNYTGSDLSPSAMFTTQLHERGHSLAQMLGLAKVNTEDPFAGRLQDCFNQKSLQGVPK